LKLNLLSLRFSAKRMSPSVEIYRFTAQLLAITCPWWSTITCAFPWSVWKWWQKRNHRGNSTQTWVLRYDWV